MKSSMRLLSRETAKEITEFAEGEKVARVCRGRAFDEEISVRYANYIGTMLDSQVF
jgi:hypothetical protein